MPVIFGAIKPMTLIVFLLSAMEEISKLPEIFLRAVAINSSQTSLPARSRW